MNQSSYIALYNFMMKNSQDKKLAGRIMKRAVCGRIAPPRIANLFNNFGGLADGTIFGRFESYDNKEMCRAFSLATGKKVIESCYIFENQLKSFPEFFNGEFYKLKHNFSNGVKYKKLKKLIKECFPLSCSLNLISTHNNQLKEGIIENLYCLLGYVLAGNFEKVDKLTPFVMQLYRGYLPIRFTKLDGVVDGKIGFIVVRGA